ncbi:hypothetical protein PanWU01x14_059390, partial [Parasponia andersonii]
QDDSSGRQIQVAPSTSAYNFDQKSLPGVSRPNSETHEDRSTDTAKESSMPFTKAKQNEVLSDTNGPTLDILSTEIMSEHTGWPHIPEVSMTRVDIDPTDNNNGSPIISKLDPINGARTMYLPAELTEREQLDTTVEDVEADECLLGMFHLLTRSAFERCSVILRYIWNDRNQVGHGGSSKLAVLQISFVNVFLAEYQTPRTWSLCSQSIL